MADTHDGRQGVVRACGRGRAIFIGKGCRVGVLAAFAACLACCAAVCAFSPVAAWGEGSSLGGVSSAGVSGVNGVLANGLVVAGSPTEGEQLAAQSLARRDMPEAFTARERSRTEYEGLDPEQAVGVAKSAFPELIDQPAGGAPELSQGERVVGYRTDHAAEVSLPGGQSEVIESIAPIAVASGNGHLPIELQLQEVDGGFAPVRSDLALSIPEQLREGVSLSGVGVSLTPVAADGTPLSASEGALDGAAAVWQVAGGSGDGQDLESVAKATSGGFDLTSLLLSERSPGKLYFRVGAPAGAQLTQNRDGSVGIASGGGSLATISPVSAEDAEGANVPVSTVLHGDVLEVSLDLEGEYRYPIAVDPELETNDSRLSESAEHIRSNWEFHTSSTAHFEKHAEPGVERLETKGIAPYTEKEFAFWGYQTKGVSHIYEIKTQTSGHNKGNKIESYLEFLESGFLESGGTRETKKTLSTESENPEYENKAVTACAANASKVEECLPSSGKANNAVVFEQAASASTSNYGFSDSMTQGIVSIAEPSGTHSTTSYNTSSSTVEVEVEVEGKKEKVKRANALHGSGSWLSKLGGKEGGAIELEAADTGIGVSGTKLEYESAPKTWTPLEEHNYLAENGCQGVQCYVTHNESWMLTPTLPNGESKLRYRAHEAITGTESSTSEGEATVKVDTKKPHGLIIAGLPGDGELSEREYELTVYASDGEGEEIPSSGIKSIELIVDGHEYGTAGGSCTIAQGECTASNKWKINGAELGAGKHEIEVIATDNAGNVARYEQRVSIRHSTPVALGPGSVDLQSGDFSLGAQDVSLGSGLTVGRNYSSRAPYQGGNGPLGPQWSLSVGNDESLVQLPDEDMMLTASDGSQTIFAALGSNKFESPPGDSNIELSAEEVSKKVVAYYLKNAAAHTSVKFERPTGGLELPAGAAGTWVPAAQEGTGSSDTVTYTYNNVPAVSEYAVPGAEGSKTELWSITDGPDGNEWFVDPWAGKIGKISAEGAVTTYSLPSEIFPESIATGPDGNLWFTDTHEHIGKITPSGKVTTYSVLPHGGGGSHGIAAGPNGWMWYTDSSNQVVQINPKAPTEFTYSTFPAGSEPTVIAPGPEKTMWVVLAGSHKIAKLTTTSKTEYELPEKSRPVDITEGPGASMWFTNAGTKKIGKITMSGTVSEYPVEWSTPKDLAKGPEGDIWFTAPYLGGSSPGAIGKVTPAGEVSEYSESTNKPTAIAPGPAGELWFTTGPVFPTYDDGIGSISPPGMVARPTQVLAPKPAGVSCSGAELPIYMNEGCRALEFHYGKYDYAKGEARSEWGEFAERLKEVSLVAYNPASKRMEETPVAKYEYDHLGRLRAEWDPRVSPALKMTYGYDEEGHVTALSSPGQEPWTFTYGAIAGDKGTGRLLKAARAPASAELWKGEAVANTEAPKVIGSPTEGVTLAASTGKWSGNPASYAYQWRRCASAESCTAIPGATNPNYTVQAADVGDTLSVTVQATNAGGTLAAGSSETATVKTLTSSVSEYSVPSGSLPAGMTAGPEAGTLWFANTGSNKVGKVTSSGTITEYALPGGSGPEGITKGPDGNIWFTENSTSKVGKITTSGTITEYALPSESKPKSIVAGPDGNLWFTENSNIGKITTSGTITEYTVPTKAPTLRGITVGPDGNLWFAERGKVGKITTSGTITEYTVPGGGAKGITAGPDGNLWFNTNVESKVGKITTSGTVTEYPLPTSLVEAEYISSIGGALWVTSKYTNHLYRMTTSGDFTEYSLPSGSEPEQMAVNSLGETWYAEYNNKLARLSSSAFGGGEAKSPEPGSTLEYNVPVSGVKAPHNMSEGEVAKWGQVDDPSEATAIFPPDEPQSWPATGYKRANVYYLDEQGRQVNVASPSTNANGAIATTEYNEFNDVIRTLTPDNRLTALAAGAESAAESKLLDTQSTYNGEGAKEGEVAEPGSMLVESYGPQHMIKYHGSGEGSGETKEKLARDHKVFAYDQGAPGGETYHLLTEESDLARLSNKEEVEVRTTKKSYSGQSNLGWKLRTPTSVTVDPAGTHEGSLNLKTTTEYNPSTGQVTEVRGAGAETTLTYASKFGEAGIEAGKLKDPWGVAVNSEGKLWVVDSANDRVEQFSSSGSYITKFGEAGSGNGQLNEPEGIAIDSAGHIWVADTANNRIEEFSSTGAFIASVGSLGSEPGKFKAPAALAFDSKGDMWVTDTGNNRVEEFNKEAKFSSEFGAAGSEPGKLSEPKGIAVDSGEHVWVADTGNNRIQEFSSAGSLLKHFGTPGAGEGQLNKPIDLKIDSLGDIWTVDSLNDRAESFSPNGAYVTQIGWKGTESGQLTEPRALAFDATGKAWVTDSSNNRLEQWSKGPNAHDQKTVYYSAAANSEYPSCGEHPEWGGLVCETLPAKQPELMGLPKLPVTTSTYNMYNEPETITETFGSTTRTKKETYDAAGRKISSEVSASTGISLPKVNFTYNSEQGSLEKQTTEGEGKSLTSEFNRLGQQVKYTDADGNVAKYKYAGPENDYLLEEASDSSDAGTSKQTYEYDPTTKLRTKLVDSAAGSFTASYDAEGKLASVSYPYSMCADYTYNSVGEATSVQYLKTSNCTESEPGVYYSDTQLSSVRGELLSQTSTLANESYAYDTVGRLTETQETPTGEGCTVRAYAYDETGERASSTSRTPGTGGACQSEGGTLEAHNYDEAGRLADGSMSYDGLGNITKLPAADSEGHELTSTFYADNAVATQTQSGVTNEYKLDPEGRIRETTTGSTKTKSHYDDPGEAVAWTENAEQWTRNIPGIDGTLIATQTNGATPVLQLHDLHGDVVATIGDKAGETKLLSTYNSTEFGVPNAGKAPPKFAWLGAAGVESLFTTGVITYGATSYVPQVGSALQSESVETPGRGGGSGLGAAYTMQEEPWVMQGAARSAAEAPGLEAAREQAAREEAEEAAEEAEEAAEAAEAARGMYTVGAGSKKAKGSKSTGKVKSAILMLREDGGGYQGNACKGRGPYRCADPGAGDKPIHEPHHHAGEKPTDPGYEPPEEDPTPDPPPYVEVPLV
jgi:streptogramin lyase